MPAHIMSTVIAVKNSNNNRFNNISQILAPCPSFFEKNLELNNTNKFDKISRKSSIYYDLVCFQPVRTGSRIYFKGNT